MSLDLVTPPADPQNPDVRWLYYHATLQRLFHPETDGRLQFFSQVPGLINWIPRTSIAGTPLPFTDCLIHSYLLEFEQGYVAVFGGTRLTGWPYHVFSAIEVAHPDSYYFPAYFYLLARELSYDILDYIGPADSRPITFCGHSLGGACSVVSCYLTKLRSNKKTPAAVTFGCPKTRFQAGMDDKDFTHIRVANMSDPVRFLPLNLIKVPLSGQAVKALLTGMHHYGTGVTIHHGGSIEFRDSSSFFPLIALSSLHNLFERKGLIEPHFMYTYAFILRQHLAREGIDPDPWFDRVNAYLNNVEGLEWDIPGFPLEAPPALDPSVTPPTPTVDVAAVLEANENIVAGANANYLAYQPIVPVQANQSLAAVIAGYTGRDIREVSIHLASQPVPNPASVTLADMVECAFDGYNPVGAPEWISSPPAAAGLPPRYARRVFFQCNGAAQVEDVYHWYVVQHEGLNDSRSLLQYGSFGRPVRMDRVKTLCLEINAIADPL